MPAWLQNRRNQVYLGLGVVVVVALVAVVLLSGGGTTPTAAPSINVPSPTTPAPSPTPSPVPSGNLVFSGRDPFQQIIATTPSPSPGATPSASPTGSPTPSVSPPGTPPPAPGGGSSIEIGGYTVVLIDTYTRAGVGYAQAQVDSTTYTVAVGHTFARHFELTAIDPPCASFLYGDQAFTLCATANK